MVKRYEPHLKEVRGEDPTATMLEWSNGDWIEFGHYEALAAELAGCKQQIAIAPTITKMMEGDNARIAQLEADLKDNQECLSETCEALAVEHTHVEKLEAVLRKVREVMLPATFPRDANPVYSNAIADIDLALRGTPSETPTAPTGNYTDSIDVAESFAAETPDDAWLCVCRLTVKKGYTCLCGGREDNSRADRFDKAETPVKSLLQLAKDASGIQETKVKP